MFQGLRPCALVATLVLLGGCANAPVQAMSDTRQAIQAAEAAGAQQAAPDKLQAARDGLKRAEDLIRARDYRAAKREALTARQHAAEALAASTAH
jgi:hypothetical protein